MKISIDISKKELEEFNSSEICIQIGILKENLSDYRKIHLEEINKNSILNKAYLVQIKKKQSGSDSSREYYLQD